jgi:hypothetical protein
MVEGNTKTSTIIKETQRLFYCFTMYPVGIETWETVETSLSKICKKWIFGVETCPTTGRIHLQGFMALRKRLRISEIKLPFNPHLEPCKGSEEQNLAYCSKDKNVYSFGYPKPIDTISIESFNSMQKLIFDLFMGQADKRKIYWFYDPVGGSGKSDLVKYLYVNFHILFCNGGKCTDLVNLVFNTADVPAMFWDLPRDHSMISYAAIESIKNGMVCNTKYETGVKVFNPPHIFILSNSLPELSNFSKDRWCIYEVSDQGHKVSLMSLL